MRPEDWEQLNQVMEQVKQEGDVQLAVVFDNLLTEIRQLQQAIEDEQRRCIAAAWDYMKRELHAEGIAAAIRRKT